MVLVEAWARARSADDMRIEIVRGRSALTVVERRPPWNADATAEWTTTPVARLRRSPSDRRWTLAWPRANGTWSAYEGIAPSADVADLLAEVDRDPDGVFWGSSRAAATATR